MRYRVTVSILLAATFLSIKTVQTFNDEFIAIFLRGTLFPFPLPTYIQHTMLRLLIKFSRGVRHPSLSAIPFIALDCLCQVQPSHCENHAGLPLRPHRPSASSISPLLLHLVPEPSFSFSSSQFVLWQMVSLLWQGCESSAICHNSGTVHIDSRQFPAWKQCLGSFWHGDIVWVVSGMQTSYHMFSHFDFPVQVWFCNKKTDVVGWCIFKFNY